MSTPLRVLIVEDSEDDALLLVRELRRGGYEPAYERVDTPETMSAALDRQTWDIIIADYVMPRFSGPDALKLMQKKGIDLPFIIVSGKIGEDIAVEAMKAGAHDYVTKQNLARLIPAIDRELREAEVRRDRRRAEDALRESEERYRSLVELSPDAIGIQSEGRVAFINNAGAALLGATSPEELIGRPILDFVHPDYQEIAMERVRRMVEEREMVPLTEEKFVRLDGTIIDVEVVASFIVYQDKPGVMVVFRDITERKMMEQHKREFYRRTILAATGGKLMICEQEEIESIAGLPVASWEIGRAEDMSPIRLAVTGLVRSVGMEESKIDDFVFCAGEAGTNAIKHAGGGTLSLHKQADSLMFVVSDRGPGIEALALPEVALKRGYTTAASLGMGYKTMISLADMVYLATGPDGTTVAVKMKLRKEEAPPDILGLPDAW